ncbi:MAG TPA: agmatinase [Gemmataceae bacterium]|nr:agmatinase [Gemmataceae bacterium]
MAPSRRQEPTVEYLAADKNFLKIEEEAFSAYAACRFVIQPAPYEHTSSYRTGSKDGPEAMIRASHYVELYDEELNQETYRQGGICTLPPLDFTGRVDEAAVVLIEERMSRLLADGKFPIMLGAEHTATLGTVRAFRKQFPRLAVLQIDAHSDLRADYEGNRYSHASVMARVQELGVPLVQVGIRAQCREEAERIRASTAIHTLYAHQLRSRPRAEWIGEVVRHLAEDVYVTVDADGFDPSIVPAVGTPEPNGLAWEEALTLVQAVCANRRVVGFDVVELAPLPKSTVSEYTLAKFVYKFIGLVTRADGRRA